MSSKKIIQSKVPLSLALGLAAFHALAFAFALGLVDFGLFHPEPLSTCMVSNGSQSWLCFKQRNHQPAASTCINPEVTRSALTNLCSQCTKVNSPQKHRKTAPTSCLPFRRLCPWICLWVPTSWQQSRPASNGSRVVHWCYFAVNKNLKDGATWQSPIFGIRATT